MSGKKTKNKNKINKKNINILILIIIILFFLFFFLMFFRPEKKRSIVESRALVQFPKSTIKSFLSGQYQQNLETAMSDQIFFGQTIKINIGNLKTKYASKILALLITEDENKKYLVGGGNEIFTFGKSKYLITKPYELAKEKSKIDKVIDSYNKNLDKNKTYFYFVNSYRNIDFSKKENNNELKDYIFKNLKLNNKKELKINNIDEYEKYFYMTDHHWNHKGSYKGYVEIVDLLGIKEKPLKPKKEIIYDQYFYGSNARKGLNSSAKEKFTVYEYKYRNMKTYIDGEERDYGNPKCFNSNITIDKYENLYGEYYGNDYAEVIFDTNSDNKDNLLVISASYSNAIKKLIAGHFNKTYFIDLRHYERVYKKEFNLKKYVKENDIDKILILGYVNSFMDPIWVIKE